MRVYYINKKYKSLFTTFVLILIIYFTYFAEWTSKTIILKDECKCGKDVHIKKIGNKNYMINYNDKKYNLHSLPVLACNLYHSLKRGPHQKVVAYSLYGKDKRYYEMVSNILLDIEHYYPDYVMRLYHDSTVDNSFKCDLQCKHSHVDFCDVDKFPNSLDDMNKTITYKYVHSSIWRFIALGDSFVDLFLSRDTDSEIIQREYDSVQEWLNSDNVGHIMRGKFSTNSIKAQAISNETKK